jgi:hypothetical protein
MGCDITALFGYTAVVVAIAAASVGCIACQVRKNSDFLI